MIGSLLVCALIIGIFGIFIALLGAAGVFDPITKTPKQVKLLKKENAQLRSENEQLQLELTAYRLQLPWWVEQEKDGTQE